MQKQTVKLHISQQIAYQDVTEIERHDHTTSAIYYELASFSKLVYQDSTEQTIEIKWHHHTPMSHIEIKQPNGTMLFQSQQTTPFTLNSQAGRLDLQIYTQAIHWHFSKSSPDIYPTSLSISYQVLMGNEILGNYDFRLIYER